MASKKTNTPIRLDPGFKDTMKSMKRKVELEQDADVSLRELSKRMDRSMSMKVMERELMEDARAKRRLNLK